MEGLQTAAAAHVIGTEFEAVLREQLLDRQTRLRDARHEQDVNLEVLRLLVSGASNQEIADQLFIGVSTVKKHINHIFGKLGVESRTQAIVRAHALNLF